MTAASSARNSAYWRVEFLESVGSTNDELAARVAAGAAPGLVLATTNQTAGHGRLGRSWVSPPGSGLALSALVQPPASDVALTPLVAGLAVQAALQELGLPCALKWPNDILIGGLKVSGVLCRALGECVVIGVGVNTNMASADLPTANATSLALQGVDSDAVTLLNSILAQIAHRIDKWQREGSGVIVDEYRAHCSTIGMNVLVELPDGQLLGIARDIADDGALIVESDGVLHQIAAGDVMHVRPAG